MNVDIPATLIFVFVTTFTPGPNNLVSASMGVIHGYRRVLPLMLGIATGFVVIMLFCATLSSLLAARLPAVAPYLRYAGGLYILWLALGVYRGSASLLEDPESVPPPRFRTGVLLQFLNVKVILYGLTVFSAFLFPVIDRPATFILAPPLLALASFSSISVWALAGHLVRRHVSTPGRAKAVGLVLAAALVYTALSLAGLIPW
ncbi:MAG: LysE family transporter [Candidatus Krumholzibacteriota bacterium]|nr:LysE family transporter [Candidatus Krumholzibacteriota bacterium]